MREKTVEAKVVNLVKERGGVCWKFVSPSMTGVPDRVCIFPGGTIIFIELKRPGLKDGRSEKQKRVFNILANLDCDVVLINDPEDFRRYLDAAL